MSLRESLSVTFDNKLELAWARVLCDCRFMLLLGSHYRPPGTDPNLRMLEDAIFAINRTSVQTVLVGNFNVNLLGLTSSDTADLTSSMLGFGFAQLVSEPTRVTSTSATLIDHVYVPPVTSSTLTLLPPLGTAASG